MLLIISDPHHVEVIEGIELKDGYMPAVGQYQPVWYQDGLPQIEPAMWFKTSIVTCVLLNVYDRVLTWTTQTLNTNQLGKIKSSSPENITIVMESFETHSKLDSESHDLDASLEEMFEAGEYLLSLRTPTVARGGKKRMSQPDPTTINKIIVKLLHCYLLPTLKIKPSQLPIVEAALSYQESLLVKIDVELEKVMNAVARTKSALQTKRQTLVDQFQDFKSVILYPREILILLESQFQEDIKHSNVWLEKIQDQVNILKKKQDADELAKKRAERDDVVGKQVKFLMARENVVNALAIERPRTKANSFKTCFVHDEGEFVVCDMGHYDVKSSLEMYAKVHEVLLSEREERTVLVARKNLMISVREAIRETTISLHNGEVTTGSSNNKTRSRRATDVLAASVPDQWLTLTEKVSECLLANSEHRNMHCRFARQIGDKLAASISVAKLAYREGADTMLRLQRRRRSNYLVRREVQSAIMAANAGHKAVKHEVATLLRSRADSCTTFRHRMDSIIKMNVEPKESKTDENEIIQEQIKNELRLLQAQIHAHFDLMSSELQMALNEPSEVAYYKIWLCYEVHFYDGIMHDLLKLYHLSYRLVSYNLKRNAAYVTLHDLAIQETWLVDLLARKKSDDETEFTSSLDETDRDVDANDVKVVITKNSPPPNDVNETKMEESAVLNLRKEGVTRPIPTVRSSHDIAMHTLIHKDFEASNEVTSSSSESDMDALHSLVERLSFIESPRMLSKADTLDETSSDPLDEPISFSSTSPAEFSPLKASSTLALDFHFHGYPDYVTSGLPTNGMPSSELTEEQARPSRCGNRLLNSRFAKPRAIKPAYRSVAFNELFAAPIRSIMALMNEDTPLNKLQLMTKCVRQIQKAVINHHNAMRRERSDNAGLEIVDEREESLMCCDDFLTILTLILLHLDAKTLSDLYPHVVMLTDMMAPFLTSGLHSNSLTHFYGAYQVIFSTMVMKQSAKTNSLE